LPETLEKFLDEHCLLAEGNVTNEKFKISLKFDFLVPPYEHDQFKVKMAAAMVQPGNTKGGSITVPLTSCLTGLESAV
jgi:hypothetical protein